MLEKEKEWYDIEIDDDFFDDEVKDLKGFGNFLNKKTNKKSNSNSLNENDNHNTNDDFEKEFNWKVSTKDFDDENYHRSNINHKDIKVSNHNNFSAIVNTTKKEEIKITLDSHEIENQEIFHISNSKSEAKISNNLNDFQTKKNDNFEVSQFVNQTTEIEIELNDDNDDDKEPKLSFDEYLIENQINLESIKANICAALYIAGDEGLDIRTLKKVIEQPTWFIKKIMTIMIGEYWKNESIGISIELYQKVFKFVTKPKCFESLGKVINTKFKNPLSQSVMETLAIIAYNQPCRRSVIEKIRAKDPKSAIDRLISLDLISSKQSDLPGRPFVYTVTNKFYDLFDLKSLSQLPKIETRLLNEIPTNEIDNNIDD